MALSLEQRRAFVFPDNAPQSRIIRENLSKSAVAPIVFCTFDPLHPRLLHVHDGYRTLSSESMATPNKKAVTDFGFRIYSYTVPATHENCGYAGPAPLRARQLRN